MTIPCPFVACGCQRALPNLIDIAKIGALATPEDLRSFVRQIWEQILRIITIGVVLEMCRKLGAFKWFRGKTMLLAELFETRHLGESVKARRSGRIF